MADTAKPGLDPIGWFIVTTHQPIGHDKTAALIGAPAGDKSECLICQYEQYPGGREYDASGILLDLAEQRELKRQAVIRALAPRDTPGQPGRRP